MEPSAISNVPIISSPEELDGIITSRDPSLQNSDPAPEPSGKTDVKDDIPSQGKAKSDQSEPDDSNKQAKSNSDYDGGSLVHYLKEKYDLPLNISDTEKLTPDQEREVIESILERITDNVNNVLEQYNYIEEMLQDEEIQEVLRIKSEGKSVKEYYKSLSSVSDDELVKEELKRRFPKSSPEVIEDMIQGLKEKNQYASFLESVKQQLQEEEKKRYEEEIKRKAEEERLLQEEMERRHDEFVNYLEQLDNLYGVPLTDKMKNTIYKIAVEEDETGMTYLEKALQSRTGLVLAAAGIGLMRDLINARSLTEANRKKNDFIERVFNTTERLQSSGKLKGASPDEDELARIANTF